MRDIGAFLEEGPWTWPLWLFYLIIRLHRSVASAQLVVSSVGKDVRIERKTGEYERKLGDVDIYRSGKLCLREQECQRLRIHMR